MLIHVSCLVDMHCAIKERVIEYLADLEENIRNYAGVPGTAEYLKHIFWTEQFVKKEPMNTQK